MTIETATSTFVRKPWGSTNLTPWSDADVRAGAVGEIWFGRENAALASALLLKLLFTREPLSIQVHPDDGQARAVGEPNGKTEAWYILGADPGASVALGLIRRLEGDELRTSIEDASIADLVAWRDVSVGDVVFVPARTIHAIGAGLVLAEIQQRSDTTYRLFDQGRDRALHVEEAVAVSRAEPPPPIRPTRRFSPERLLLVASPFFVLERIDIEAGSTWLLDAMAETWLLVLDGEIRVDGHTAHAGGALFLQSELVAFEAGSTGLAALVAYAADAPAAALLRRIEEPAAASRDLLFPALSLNAAAAPPFPNMELPT